MKEDEFFDTPIGPSWDEQIRRQKKSHERAKQELLRLTEEESVRRENFAQKYGPDLRDFGRAYALRVRPDSWGMVPGKEGKIEVQDARELFATALLEQLTLQPEETRAEWLTGFLEDLDELVPPIQKH